MTGTRRANRRRALLATALLVLVGIGVGVWAAGRGGNQSTGGHGRRAAFSAGGAGGQDRATAPSGPAATTTTAQPATTTTTSPGTLPQTPTEPTASGPQFQAEMAALWQGVVSGSVTMAMPAFFPEGAYLQLKAISDPRTDYANRLVNEFHHDLDAAHALLGSSPASATFQSVQVPQSYAHWVQPGVCYNSIGYWEVPNARVVYQLDGAVKSFGIASMISWRGQWYVVHLGLVTRPTTTQRGIVDAPTTGPGTSAYSSTC